MNDRRGFLLGLILLFGALSALMLKPFLAYLLGAMILAFALRVPHNHLNDHIGERLSAFLLTISSIVLAVIPLVLVGVAVADDARDVVNSINTTQVVDLDSIELQLEEITGQELDLQQNMASAVNRFSSETFGGFSRVVNLLTNLGIGLSLMIFLIFYFLKDGRELIEWIKDLSTLPEPIEDNLLAELSNTTSAVMKGHILVAIAQGVIAGIGLMIFGVPNPLFWTFIMVILGMIPIIGTLLVWLPAAVYLFLAGETTSAIMLAAYGFIIVGLTDNFLRPIVVDDSADLHPAVIILGVLGGVSVFGAPGLFIGPIVFGVLKSVLSVFIQHYGEL